MTVFMLHIRYKDGRDKTIFTDHIYTFDYPKQYIRNVPHYPPPASQQTGVVYNPLPQPVYEAVYSLTTVPPIQEIGDTNGAIHFICIDEILDITVEAIEDDQD